ncbi:hypothetical protein ACP6H4_02145 [Vibrio harveyi]|uniref:hypothetical protein n=1 Tax=Vibrio harveyi TaxID=669 RepID=UPI003CEDB7A9
MSGTTSKTRGKARAAKPTDGTADKSVEKNTDTEQAETKPQESVETNSTTTESSSEKAPASDESDSDKPEKVDEKAKDETPAPNAGDVPECDGDALGILGAFKVRAKSDQGFWRSGIKFRRLQETVVLVVDQVPENQPEILAEENLDPEFVVFLSVEKAQRVHREPNLIVEDCELSDVIDVK